MKFYLLGILSLLLSAVAQAAPPRLLLDVAAFRNTDTSRKGGVLEVYATVDGNSLTYQRRAVKAFQASAVLTLEVLKADGQIVYSETIKLKPPVLRDTAQAIKNPMSFQKRVILPDGTYTVRGQVRDQFKAGGNRILEVPVALQFDQAGLRLSDVVVLAKAPSRSSDESNFTRGGYLLIRTPGGLYGRGADRLFAYAELYNAPAEQTLATKYRLRLVGATKDAATGAGMAKALGNAPHLILVDMDIAKVPAGEYDLIVEVRGAKNKLLASKTTRVLRQPDTYAPAAAAIRL
ncbi:hypothetical protein FY528_05830 [Hymenobacter lutimineralis]|uniref:Uncharacterized protein n=1 Tax=Hymenobacter lutimineralis TaxID=2606448 RepID=A0A5D6V9G3_9BACT|nr:MULTISPECIES: hypothetical protein [Hymenobacter]QIX62562.1 hypothetical protein HER32_15820 [Hymenobacter sp. BT18]TYZ11875.1 hypothetical protein FY528_05830 [Hymenobacter lutimineralis]